MKNLIRLPMILSFLFSINVRADKYATEGGLSAPGCTTCKEKQNGAPEDVKKVATEMLEFIKKPIGCDNQSARSCLLIDWLKWKHFDYAKRSKNCQSFFIDPNGSLGKFSQLTSSLIYNDIIENAENSVFLMNNNDITKYCPEFSTFNTAQKAAFHSWIFELTGFPESSCNVNVAPNKEAPTTTAVCLYQLEDKPEIRAWRSAGNKIKRCAVSEAELLTVEGCTGCAFDEYKRKIKKHGTAFGTYDEKTGKRVNGSYWASHNVLPPKDVKCFLDNQRTTVKGPKAKPDWLLKCPGANWEWRPRVQFFGRLQRFPLCGTQAATKEIMNLNAYLNKKSSTNY